MRKIPNTFGIDVTAARFLEYGSEDELRELIAAGQVVAPWLHIGGGSNLLFIKDYEGTVLHSRIGGLEVTSEDEEHVSVRVGAGVVWDDFVAYCVERHWYGAENLSLIPGEVGASAVQNIGAYGVEVKDLITSVETINMARAHTAATTVEVAITGGISRNSHTQHEHKGKQKCEKSLHGFLLSKSRRKEKAQPFLTAPCWCGGIQLPPPISPILFPFS